MNKWQDMFKITYQWDVFGGKYGIYYVSNDLLAHMHFYTYGKSAEKKAKRMFDKEIKKFEEVMLG